MLPLALLGCDKEPRDYVRPVLTLNGQAVMSISYRETFSDPGVRATDDRDGAATVIVTGAVESGRIGEYTLTYTATDVAGNTARATRTVRVVDDVPPTITLNGLAAVELERDEPYWDPGATAEDEIDGAVETTVQGEVGEAAGEYALVYRAVDAAGNAAEATRAVTRAPGDYMLEVDMFGEGEVRLAVGEATTPFRCEGGACFGRFQEGERVELEATAGPGRRFKGWGTDVCDEIADGRCALAMDRNRVALPAFVSEEPLTLHDDVVMLTPEQIEGLLFWAPHAGVAVFDEWTDLRELVPGSVMVSDGVPDEDGFPTEAAFLVRVLSVQTTLDGSQLVTTAPAGLNDLYASGTLVARGELTRAALERAKLAPGVKLAPVPDGQEGPQSGVTCQPLRLDCTFDIDDRPPLTDGSVRLWGTTEVLYEPGSEVRVELTMNAEARVRIGLGKLKLSIPIGSTLPLVLYAPPPIILNIGLTLTSEVDLGFSDTVVGRATLTVVGRAEKRGFLSTRASGYIERRFAIVDGFEVDRVIEARPRLQLGLELAGKVSVAGSAGLKMGIEPYFGARFDVRMLPCVGIYPYWGVEASAELFLRVWGFPWRGLKADLFRKNYPGSSLSPIRTLACSDSKRPTPPSNLTVRVDTDRSVALAWSASSDEGGTGVTAYRVYRGGGHIDAVMGTSYVDRNAGTGTHCYVVTAVDAALNQSDNSSEECATVQPDEPPQSLPTKPVIQITGSYSLSWSPHEDRVEYSLWQDSPDQFQYARNPTNPIGLRDNRAGVTYCYRIRATNSAGSRDSDSRCYTTPEDGNSPPTASTDPDETVVAGERLTLLGYGEDADGEVTNYRWTQESGRRVSLRADDRNVWFIAPETDTEIMLTLRLTVTDNDGATGTVDVQVTVWPEPPLVNDDPNAEAGGNQVVKAGERVVLSGLGSDDDRGIVEWRWEQFEGPRVSLSGASSPVATFVAPSVSRRTNKTDLRFRLTVTDADGEADDDDMLVKVYRNKSPSASAGSNLSVASGATVTLNGSRSRDRDGTVAGYAWTQTAGPTVTLSGASSATATFTAPVVSTRTELTFRLTVTDDIGARDSDTVDVTVSPNSTPVADAGSDQTVAAGAAVMLNGSGSDADGTVAGYAWTQTAGPTVTLSGASSATVTFTAPAVATRTTLTFRLTVTDNNGALGTDEATVTVTPLANVRPVANAGSDQTVAAGAAVTLNGNGSDADGAVAGYVWTQTAGPTVPLSGASSATATFAAPAVTSRTTLTFRLTVTDNDGATGADEITVTVLPANRPPVADAGRDQSVAANAAVTLNGSGSDPDGTVAGYAWTQTAGPTVTLSGASSATATFAAPAVTSRTTLTFRLTVTDNNGATGADEITVTVSPPNTNLPPVANAGEDQSVGAGAAVTLNGSGSDDRRVAGYAWTQTAGPTVTLSGASSATATFTAPAVATSTTLTFRLTVTDDDGASGTDDATVTVAPADGNTPVHIPDAALRTMLLAALGKAPGDTITSSEMAGLTSFSAVRSGVSDLTGLEFATSLTSLDLTNNPISNISVLSGLTSLQTLQLRGNEISDISVLSGLTSLTFLGLSGNSVSDISVLSGLTSLRTLLLSSNPITNFSVLSRLTSLRGLYIQNIPGGSFSNISVLSGLTLLDWLHLDNNSISDISVLSGLTSLGDVSLDNNSISDISALSGLTSLRLLSLDNNSISDAKPLVDNAGLRGDTINLRRNPLSAQSVNTHIPALRARGNTVNCSLADGTSC